MKDKILELINQTDWTLIKDQDDIKMMQFQNGKEKINIYWGTMTITFIVNGGTITYHNRTFAQLKKLLGTKKQNIFEKIFNAFKI